MAQSDRDNNKEVTEIEVLLEGKVYKISGCESVEYMQKVANYINAKERELKASSSYNKLPDVLRAYLMNLNIADDYFKMKQKYEEIKRQLEKQDRDICRIKHEAADLQTKLAQMKKNGNSGTDNGSEPRTTGSAYENNGNRTDQNSKQAKNNKNQQ